MSENRNLEQKATDTQVDAVDYLHAMMQITRGFKAGQPLVAPPDVVGEWYLDRTVPVSLISHLETGQESDYTLWYACMLGDHKDTELPLNFEVVGTAKCVTVQLNYATIIAELAGQLLLFEEKKQELQEHIDYCRKLAEEMVKIATEVKTDKTMLAKVKEFDLLMSDVLEQLRWRRQSLSKMMMLETGLYWRKLIDFVKEAYTNEVVNPPSIEERPEQEDEPIEGNPWLERCGINSRSLAACSPAIQTAIRYLRQRDGFPSGMQRLNHQTGTVLKELNEKMAEIDKQLTKDDVPPFLRLAQRITEQCLGENTP